MEIDGEKVIEVPNFDVHSYLDLDVGQGYVGIALEAGQFPTEDYSNQNEAINSFLS